MSKQHDDTQNKDDELEHIKRRADIIFNTIHDGMAFVRTDAENEFRYIFINRAFCDFFNDDDQAIIGKTPLDIFGQTEGAVIAETYRQCLETNMKLELDEQIHTPGGTLYFQTTLMPIVMDGGVPMIIITKKNVTQQIISEKLLTENRRRLEAIAAGTPNVVITVSEDFTITYANNVYCNEKVEDAMGTSLLDHIDDANKELVAQRIMNVFGGAALERFDLSQYYDGVLASFRTTVVPLIKDSGISEVVLISVDVTRERQQETELRKWGEIFKTAGWGIATGNADGVTFDLINPSFADMYGYTLDEIKRLQIKDIFSIGMQKKFPEEIEKIYRYGHHVFESVHVRKDGTEFPVLVDGTAIKDDEGNIVYRSMSVQNMSQIKSVERQLIEERAQFLTTLQSIGDGVISTDVNGNIVMMNAVAEQMTGWTGTEASGKPFEMVFRIINEVTRETVDSPAKKALENEKTVLLGNNTVLIRRNGTEISVEDSAAPIRNEDEKLIGAVVVFRDYSEKKEKLEEIKYLSFHDQLTGLYNRRYFDEELLRLDIKRNLPISVAMIDVNGLKLTNDAFGHVVGDQLLIKVAQTLKKIVRQDEIVARIGGDEFVIILPRTDYNGAENMCKRIYDEMNLMTIGKVVISVSVGYATKTLEIESLSYLLVKAEEMMYHKKITESQSMRSDTVKIIMQTLHETNEREKIHAVRVSRLGVLIGEAAHLDRETIKYLEIAGLLHDIGKIAINKQILNKPARLSTEEFKEMKRHLDVGYQILKSVNEYTNLAEAILAHHERWDGRGYPRGLTGTDIPLVARIITLADAYEAMTANRPYRSAMSRDAAIAEIIKGAGYQFDPSLVMICSNCHWEMLSQLDEVVFAVT